MRAIHVSVRVGNCHYCGAELLPVDTTPITHQSLDFEVVGGT